MRDIDWDKKLSDDDRQWALSTGSLEMQNRVLANDHQFGDDSKEDTLDDLPDVLDPEDEPVQVPQAVSYPQAGGPVARPFTDLSADEQKERLSAGDPLAGSDTGDDDFEDNYEEWKVAELKEEAGKREPAVPYEQNARKPQLIQALREWDKTYGDGESEQ